MRMPGALDPATRQAIAADDPPDELAPYLDKVTRHAYKVTDADVQALKDAGHSENEIFEQTVSAAVSAGLRRLDEALGTLA